MTSLTVTGAEMAHTGAAFEAAAPAEASEPLLLTLRAAPAIDQVAFAALACVGLTLMALGALIYFRAAPMDVDAGPALAFAAPGVAAAFAGLFFLARRARQAFAETPAIHG